jgi:NAD-dependent SIR2 family protein deacetylase
MGHLETSIRQAAGCIRQAEALFICAGAGMGVDSGLPDFRGNQGFWKAYPPFARLGYSFIDMANPHWFEKDPNLAWGFYGHRLNLYRRTTPHQGFDILLRWAEEKPGGYFVFTSNVDGQFQQAGFAEDRIVECHGSIHHLQCSAPCGEAIWWGKDITVRVDEETMQARAPLPHCLHCGDMARPNILMFGDWNWISRRTDLQQQGLNQWVRENRRVPMAIVECGAGTAVPTVRMTAQGMIPGNKATLIRINTREPQVPPGHIGLPLTALDALTRIDKA